MNPSRSLPIRRFRRRSSETRLPRWIRPPFHVRVRPRSPWQSAVRTARRHRPPLGHPGRGDGASFSGCCSHSPHRSSSGSRACSGSSTTSITQSSKHASRGCSRTCSEPRCATRASRSRPVAACTFRDSSSRPPSRFASMLRKCSASRSSMSPSRFARCSSVTSSFRRSAVDRWRPLWSSAMTAETPSVSSWSPKATCSRPSRPSRRTSKSSTSFRSSSVRWTSVRSGFPRSR